ncbi:hypothetical protein L7F22_066942 [Adiantum nelumboides]|nr:hypothetical protein [Adiantum nelumboides]
MKHIADDLEPKDKEKLVTKGFKQKKGVDFDEMFLVKMNTLQILLGLVAIEGMGFIQLDVKTSFLHGDPEEDVYMVQPEGFEVKPEKSTKAKFVCRLQKSLYGLKQSSR